MVHELLQDRDPCKSKGPDITHPKMSKELSDIAARLFCINFEKLWRSKDVPGDWKKTNVTHIYKKGLKEDPGK